MLLQLKPLFMGEISVLPIEVQLDFSEEHFGAEKPFRTPFTVRGQVTANAGIVTLRVRINGTLFGRCDRCLTALETPVELECEHILVSDLGNEDDESFVLLKDYQLELDDLLRTDLILELPSKTLCREDCKGLCPQCGHDLNEGDCGCGRPQGDPRLAALGRLLQDE